MHKKYILIAAFFAVAAYFAATTAFAQEAGASVDDTWSQIVSLIVQSALAVFALVLSLAISKLAAVAKEVLPEFLHTWIDKQRQDDLHKAAMTIVTRILQEGGDPKAEMQRVKDYVFSSAKDAIKRFMMQGRSISEMEKTVENIAISKI